MPRKKRRDYDDFEESSKKFWEEVRKSFDYVTYLSKTGKPEDSLRAIAILLVSLVVGLRLLLWLHYDTPYDIISVGVFLFFGLAFGLIFGRYYIKLIDFFINIGAHELNSLRFVVSVLFLDAGLSGAAVFLKNLLIGNITMYVLVLQIPAIFLPRVKFFLDISSDELPGGEVDVWSSLGKLNILLGIVASIITIASWAISKGLL